MTAASRVRKARRRARTVAGGLGAGRPALCPVCGDRVIRLRYEPVALVLGRPPSYQVLDLPALVEGREGRSPAELEALGVHRVGSVGSGRCRRVDHEHEIEPHEAGFSLHVATHPACRDALHSTDLGGDTR